MKGAPKFEPQVRSPQLVGWIEPVLVEGEWGTPNLEGRWEAEFDFLNCSLALPSSGTVRAEHSEPCPQNLPGTLRSETKTWVGRQNFSRLGPPPWSSFVLLASQKRTQTKQIPKIAVDLNPVDSCHDLSVPSSSSVSSGSSKD